MSSKDKVLELLENNKDEFLSGEVIAAKLGLSRNAIWKAINELRKKGYDIQAVSKKGYLLSTSNDIISAQGIVSYIEDADSSCIEKFYVYDNVDSTNKLAKEMAIKGAEHGTLVIAKSQDGGRGRRDHSFFSPEGGIYMSIILSPDKLSSLEPDRITTQTGNAVCSAIDKLCRVRPRIKPINDLFIEDKKICGILTESLQEFDSGDLLWIVVGIGINFDSDISKFPEELRGKVGALFPRGKANVSKNQLIAEIYKNLMIMA